MANEFIARKGLIALSDSQISGSLAINGSGSTLLEVNGSEGQLFSITDSLSGSLFAVSDVSGLPILEVFSDDTVKIGTFNNQAIIVNGTTATVSGSFSGSFEGNGSNLTGIDSGSWNGEFTGSANISGSLNINGTLSLPGFADVSASLAAAVAGGDDLGNHTATQNLDMGTYAITNVGNVDGVDVSGLKSDFDTLEGKTLVSSSAQISGLGFVDKTGTPVDNQIAIFTDSNTIQGTSAFTFNGSYMTIDASGGVTINDGNNDAYFQVKGTSDDDLLQVNPQLNDRVGIGTSTPSHKLDVNGNIKTTGNLIIDGTISGSGGAQLNLGAYEFGYEITTAFPITGSGLIVSSSNLPANHYNMVKIGETELLDINSLLSPNTFFIHNVDTIVVASGSEPLNIYGEGPGKLFEHNGDEFKVYAEDSLKLTISSGSSAFTNPITTNQLLTAATLASSPQYVAVWEGSPSGIPTAVKYITASTFTGGGGSSAPYSLGTFGGRYNWGSTEGNRRIAHGYTNGPIAGATANDDNFGPYLDTHTIDSTTETFAAYKMQYYAIYSPVAGVPHIKAWGRSTDTDFATNGCEMGVSVWSVDTEPSNGSTASPTATLRATSPTFTIPNSTVGYLGNGMEASGSSSLSAGTFYLVTFDLSGSLAAAANIYMNFHLWLE